jgi:hypothetical protein
MTSPSPQDAAPIPITAKSPETSLIHRAEPPRRNAIHWPEMTFPPINLLSMPRLSQPDPSA